MKSIEKTPEIKDIQDFYDKFLKAQFQEQDTFTEIFDIKRYQYLCEGAKKDNLTQTEKEEHFNMFRELNYNLSVIRNGKIVSLEAIKKNFNKNKYLELRKLLSKGKIQEKDKIMLYKLMQDAQDLGIMFCKEDGYNMLRVSNHYTYNKARYNYKRDHKFRKTSIERYTYLGSKRHLNDNEYSEYMAFKVDLLDSDYIIENGKLVSLKSIERKFDINRFVELSKLLYERIEKECGLLYGDEKKYFKRKEFKEFSVLKNYANTLGIFLSYDDLSLDLRLDIKDKLIIESFMEEIEKEKLLDHKEKKLLDYTERTDQNNIIDKLTEHNR